MPSGLIPTYKYVPPSLPSVDAKLRSCSSRRSRLFAGGTYFRASDPGLPGNNISVQIIEVQAPTTVGTGEAYCVFTNQNLEFSQNVIGKAEPKILDIKGTYQDLWIIRDLNTTNPRTHYYSISLRIRNDVLSGNYSTLPAPTLVSDFSFGKLFSHKGKLSVLLQKKTELFTAEDIVIITPRIKMYPLSAVLAPQPAEIPGEPVVPDNRVSWSPAALRASVSASGTWVQMMERSGTVSVNGMPPEPNPNPFDAQDDGVDDVFLIPFGPLNLANGDGLPASPNTERTGPSRALVHVNYGELLNGTLGEHNTVYEWVGDTASAGSWKAY